MSGLVISSLVHVLGRDVTTSSLQVAEFFGKRHDNVLQAIRNLGCSEKFRLLNFKGTDFIDKNGDAQPSFEITRSGFAFLGMGFTGAKADAFKETYINAFNMMEGALLQVQRDKERAELCDMAERAIAGNVMDRSKLGARVHNGLTSDEWREIREMIGSVADFGEGSEIERDMIYNAVHAHMIRYFGSRGPISLPFKGVMLYLREIRARYTTGYRPKYVAGSLVYDLTMC